MTSFCQAEIFVILFAWCMDLSLLANMKCKNTHSDDVESHEKYDNVFGGIKKYFHLYFQNSNRPFEHLSVSWRSSAH